MAAMLQNQSAASLSAKDKINNILKSLRRTLSEREEVDFDLLYNGFCKYMADLKGKCPDRRKFSSYDEVKILTSDMKWLRIQIVAYKCANSILTFKELENYLCKCSADRRNPITGEKVEEEAAYFGELCLGPLHKLQQVRDIFHFQENMGDVMKISMYDIVSNLSKFYIQKRDNRNHVTPEQFLEFLCKEYKAENINQLGIQITSMKLLKKCHGEGKRQQLMVFKEAEDNLMEKFSDSMNSVFDSVHGDLHRIILQNQQTKLPGLNISELLVKMTKVLKPIIKRASEIHSDSATNVQSVVDVLSRDKKAQLIFHYAIMSATFKYYKIEMSVEDILKLLNVKIELLTPKNSNKHSGQTSMGKHQPRKTSNIVSKERLLASARKILAHCDGPLTLMQLGDIRKQLMMACDIDRNDFNEFDSHGSFLDVIDSNQELKNLIGNYVIVNINEKYSNERKRNSEDMKENLIDFLKSFDLTRDQEIIPSSLCLHFQMENVKTIGDLPSLIEKADAKQNEHPSCIKYYGNLPIVMKQSKLDTKPRIEGVDHLIEMLAAAPILEDIEKAAAWKILHEKNIGPLASFLMKYKEKLSDSNFAAYEDFPGKLYRIPTKNLFKLIEFEIALGQRDDLAVALQIVSLIIYNQDRIDQIKLSKYETFLESRDYSFIIKVMMRIPLRLSSCITREVFLQPLSSSRYSLSRVCKDIREAISTDKELFYFYRLGQLMDIAEWTSIYEINGFQLDSSNKEIKKDNPNTAQSDGKIDSNKCNPASSSSPLNNTGTIDTKKHLPLENSLACLPLLNNESSSSSDDSDAEAFEFIKCIREKTFGYGVEMGEGQTTHDLTQQMLDNALDKLSTELYSQTSHFLLELIQNADDNIYPDNETTPAVVFVLEENSLTVYNNEIGFTKENIESLCSIGQSTKGKHRKGYIGHKGIGFKSVFQVTNTPEIHSGGYHVQFSKNSKPQIILPHWIDNCENINRYTPSGYDQEMHWSTKIVLPLDREDSNPTKIADTLSLLSPQLLMFLNRLKIIIFDNKISDTVEVMECSKENQITQLKHNDKISNWFVFSKDIKMPVMKEGVDTTSISLAFPSIAMGSKPELVDQAVYAFLPVNNYGLKFIIQADFDVASTRESVMKNSDWNIEIISAIPQLFVDSIHKAMQISSYGDYEQACLLLQCLPNDIMDPFRSISHDIISNLREIECIPVYEMTSLKTETLQDIKWKFVKPSEARIVNASLQELIPQHVLQKRFDLYYVPQIVIDLVGEKVLKSLGVKDLQIENIISIGTELIEEIWNKTSKRKKNKKLDDIKWISKFFLALSWITESSYDKLKIAKDNLGCSDVFPTSALNLVSLTDNAVFLPSTKPGKIDNTKFKTLWSDVNILHPDLFTHANERDRWQLIFFFERLGVSEITPSHVIRKHILPKTLEEKAIPSALHTDYLLYIYENVKNDENMCSKEDLNSIALLTTEGYRLPLKQPIYFGNIYGKEFDLAALFPCVSWPFLSDCYAKAFKNNVEELTAFFRKLGVAELFVVRKQRMKVTQEELIACGWEGAEIFPKTMNNTYIIEDLVCDELSKILKNGSNDELRNLLKVLDHGGFDALSKAGVMLEPHVELKDCEENFLDYKTLSTIWRELKTLNEWLIIKRQGKIEKYFPKSLFADTDKMFSLLDNHVPYLKWDFKDHNFERFLGIKSSINSNELMNFLITWSKDLCFTTKIDHMKNVYHYFKRSKTSDDLLDQFTKQSLIYVGNESSDKFINLDKACWETDSDILTQQLMQESGHDIIVLSRLYPELRKFFIDILKVKQYPDEAVYVDILETMAENVNWGDKESILKLLQFQSVVGQRCCNLPPGCDHISFDRSELQGYINKESVDAFRQLLSHKKVLAVTKQELCSSEDPVLFGDNKEAMSRFERKDGVYFAETLNVFEQESHGRGKNRQTKTFRNYLNVFLMVCDVKLISECLEVTELQTELFEPGSQIWHEFLYAAIEDIQRYLYVKWHDDYMELIDKRYPEKLQFATFNSVGSLEVVHRLRYINDAGLNLLSHIAATEKQHFHFYEEDSKFSFLFSKKSRYSPELAMPELVSIFANQNSNLKDALEDLLLLGIGSEGSINGMRIAFEKKTKGKLLPESEMKWLIKIPEYRQVEENLEELNAELTSESGSGKKRSARVKTEEELLRDEEAIASAVASMTINSEEICVDQLDKETESLDGVPKPKYSSNQTSTIRDTAAKSLFPNTCISYANPNPSSQGENQESEGSYLNPNSKGVHVNPVTDEMKTNPIKSDSNPGCDIDPKAKIHNNGSKTNGDNLVNGSNPIGETQAANIEKGVIESKTTTLSQQTAVARNPVDQSNGIPGETRLPATEPHTNKPHAKATESELGVTLEKMLIASKGLKRSISEDTVSELEVSKKPIPPFTNTNVIDLNDAYTPMVIQDNVLSEEKMKLFYIQDEISANSKAVGRKGEQFIYEYLKSYLLPKHPDIIIQWMNLNEESYQPFDIQIKDGLSTIFIEVKSTEKPSKELFEMSYSEMKFAYKNGDCYLLFRVTLMKDGLLPNIKKLSNLKKYLDNRAVKTFLML